MTPHHLPEDCKTQADDMTILELEHTESTNSWMAGNIGALAGDTLVFTRNQTAGRGQRGNSWESEPGKNLTASILLHPEGIAPREQFVISEAVALAVTDLLADLGVDAMVKWPNDIYAGDRKICGILIEHSILPSSIMHTIAGIGVNINQTVFLSDAPNPVSVAQLTGERHDIPSLARSLAAKVSARMPSGKRGDTCEQIRAIHRGYMERLWRGDGAPHPFLDRINNEYINARISDVAPDGILTLVTTGGDTRRYAFKEIEFIL